MKILDLGELQGTLAIFGGVYSNLHALEAFQEAVKAKNIKAQNSISTGDIVAYCAYPAASVDAIRAMEITTIAGNCEKQLAENAADCGCGFEEGSTCSLLSKTWYAHANAQITQETRDWMGDLPDRLVFSHCGKRYVVIHGGAEDISRFVWPVSSNELFEEEFRNLESQVGRFDVVIAGHCGIGFIREIGEKTWINAGAVGMPANNGEIETEYLTISEKGPEINKLTYDVDLAHQAMVACSLVQGYHGALLTGYWPSEDVLPDEMKVHSAKG